MPVNTKVWAEWLKFQTHHDPELEALVDQCAEFALAFKEGKPAHWFSILGVTGTGKTHCSRRLWNHLSARIDWRKVQFIQQEIYWPKFVAELRSGNAYDRLRDLMDWPVLFLDDIGAERDTTGFASEQLNTLLGSRAGKWTLLTSNLGIEQFNCLDARIADRIIRHPNQFIEVQTTSHSLRNMTNANQQQKQ
ncbi:MAG: ATP-binding protein [Verrucomicrobiota bacterium]